MEEEDDDVLIILDQAAPNPSEVTANEASIIPNENEILGDIFLDQTNKSFIKQH